MGCPVQSQNLPEAKKAKVENRREKRRKKKHAVFP
jgi:hypothetical protein